MLLSIQLQYLTGKKTISFFAFFLMIVSIAFGQSVPQAMNYQAVVRDINGEPITDTDVELKMSIVYNNSSVVYQELHYTYTNSFGLVNVGIGMGQVLLGDFPTIDWAAGNHFLRTEISIDGGLFVQMGASRLLSVPYAFVAQRVIESDNDTTNELQILSQFGNEVTLSQGGGTISVADDDNDPANELQDWSNLPGIPADLLDGDDVDDADADPNNELQTLSQSGNDVTLSNNGGTISVADNDNDSSNEIQDISINGHDLTLSSGSTITLPDNVDDADANPTNEIQNLSLNGIDLTITGGNTVTLPDNMEDADADPTNEIQNISLNGLDLTISGGNTVTLPDNGSDLPENPASGTMVYYDGSEWVALPPGQHTQALRFCHGAPYWGVCPELPTLTTSNVLNIRAESAKVGGNVTTSIGSPVTERGICWSTSPGPTIDDNVIISGSGLGSFTETMTGLTLGTTYYVKAYATNDLGTAYGNQKSFTTAYGYGDELGGGYIFYIAGPNEDRNNDGIPDQFMIAALEDQINNLPWGCSGINIPGIVNLSDSGCSLSANHKGFVYTNTWIAECNQNSKAAKACYNKTATVDGVTYSDWFLPSQFELKKMHATLHLNGLGGFANQFYWSSNEAKVLISTKPDVYDEETKAMGIDFSSNSGNCVPALKSELKRVRAVRVY